MREATSQLAVFNSIHFHLFRNATASVQRDGMVLVIISFSFISLHLVGLTAAFAFSDRPFFLVLLIYHQRDLCVSEGQSLLVSR